MQYSAEKDNDLPGECKWMPLEVRNFGARQEYVLASPGGRLLLLDLQLHYSRWVLDNFRNIGPVARPDFTEDALVYPDDATNKPVTLIGTCQCGHQQFDNYNSPRRHQ